MIRQALRNFFGQLLYLSVPMGIVYLFLLLALFGLGRALIADVGALVNGFVGLVRSSAEQSGVDIADFLAYARTQLDLTAPPLEVLRQIIDTRWIQSTLTGFFSTIDASFEGFSVDVTALSADFSAAVVGHVAAAGALFAFGLAAAGGATRVVLRRRTAERPPLRALLCALLLPLVQALLLVGVLALLAGSRGFALLGLALLVLLFPFLSLLSAFLLRRDRTIAFREVVCLSRFLAQLAATAVIFALTLAIVGLIALKSFLLAVLLALPLLLYAMAILSVNADSFVARLAQRRGTAASPS